jgi:hypothetical protein
MTQRTVIESGAGTRVGISASLPVTFDTAGYDVLIFTPIGQVETPGSHGVTAAVTKFTPIDTGVVAKVKGSKDYGVLSLSMANLPSDPGQAILKTASEAPSSTHFSIELRYPDDEYHYFDVICSKFEYVDGAANDVQKINCDLEICRKPVIVPQV